jgi:hypothetical protein
MFATLVRFAPTARAESSRYGTLGDIRGDLRACVKGARDGTPGDLRARGLKARATKRVSTNADSRSQFNCRGRL